MPAWIDCPECGEEFRDKPGRTKCPECGARLDLDDDFDEEPAPRRRPKAKPKSRALLFALIGVGVLLVAFGVVLAIILTGTRADPSKVTVANFRKLNAGMTRAEAEKVLAGSSSSSVSDMQTEVSRVGGGMQGTFVGLTSMFSGPGTWRRWDGVNGDVKVFGLFSEPLFGDRTERLSFSIAVEKLPGGGYTAHMGQQTIGGMFNGFPGFPAGQPMPQIQFPQMPPMPQPNFPAFPNLK